MNGRRTNEHGPWVFYRSAEGQSDLSGCVSWTSEGMVDTTCRRITAESEGFTMNRRGFLTGLLAAPTVVSASSLMAIPRNPVRLLPPLYPLKVFGIKKNPTCHTTLLTLVSCPFTGDSSSRYVTVLLPDTAFFERPELQLSPGEYVKVPDVKGALIESGGFYHERKLFSDKPSIMDWGGDWEHSLSRPWDTT